MTHTDLNAPTESTAASATATAPSDEDTAPSRPWRSGRPPARGVRGTPRTAEPTRRDVLAGLAGRLALLGTVGAMVWIVLDAASAKSPLVPKQPPIAGWLNGIGAQLSYRTFLAALLMFTCCYAIACLCGRQLGRRPVIGTIIALNLIVFIGPLLISQDAFQYIDYGRLGVFHHVNPFVSGPIAAPYDPVFRYVGVIWYRVASAYGPLFTLLSYPIVLLGIDGALWGMKLVALMASLATVAIVWACAKRLGRDPVIPVLILGVNPLWVIYGLGGAHNDLLMDALMMFGVLLALRDEDGRGAASIVAAAAIKATAIAVLPFMLLARRRVQLIWGTLIALAVIAAISLVVFGVHGLDFVSVLKRNSTFVSSDSFPLEVAHLVGLPGVFRIDRTIVRVLSVVVIAWLLWRTWRGYDWIAASSWALLVLAVSTTWLLAWYLLWSLPLAVLSRDRRVLWATLFVMALFIVHQTAPLFSPPT